MSAQAPDWFRTPAEPFRPAAFWFWHRIPTNREIGDQIADMLAKGIGRAMIQARPALPLEQYLSPAYLDAYRHAGREALRQGLRLTIYDEYGWMSGHGGGRTVRGADHLRERHLFWTSGTVGSDGVIRLRVSGLRSPFLKFLGDAGRAWLFDGGAVVWGDWEPVLLVAQTSEGEAVLPFHAADIASGGDGGCRVALAADRAVAPGTCVTAFVSARCLTSRFINYLLPEAAQRFADTVYAPLRDAAGPAADGFFFDHPHAGFWTWNEQPEGGLGNSLLWAGGSAAADRARPLLALAHGDIGPDGPALRARFLEAYAQCLHTAFFGTLRRWTEARGLGFTGHELLTHVGAWSLRGGLSGFDPRAMPGVDYFGIDAFRTETAVDAADYRPQLSARMGDSVARASGRRRCTIEQYATGRETGMPTLAGQWGLTAERFRAQGIRHLLAGARQIVLHAVNATVGEDGDGLLSARFDFAPAFNFEPWWEDCPVLFAELARLSAFLEEGEPLQPVGLLYPLETLRAGGQAPACSEHFGWWAEALAEAGIGFRILDERTLAADLGQGSGIRTLVLPAVDCLARADALHAILAFAEAGGRVLRSGPPLAPVSREPAGEPVAAALRALLAEREAPLEADRAGVIRAVASLPRPLPDARFDAGPSRVSVMRSGETWRIAAFNDGANTRTLRLHLGPDAMALSIWDADTGEVHPLAAAAGREIALEVGSQRLVCLSAEAASGTADSRPRAAAQLERREAPPLPGPVALRDGWTLTVEGGEPFAVSVETGWEQQGLPRFAGTGLYRRTLDAALDPRFRWHLVLPGMTGTVECRVDGRWVGRRIAGATRFALPPDAQGLEIAIAVRNTAANRFYPGTAFWDGRLEPSGLVAPPMLVPSDPAVEASPFA